MVTLVRRQTALTYDTMKGKGQIMDEKLSMKVFVIGNPQIRKSNITPVLDSAKIDYEIIPANFLVDFPKNFHPERSLLLAKRRLGLGEVGCALSHLQCYKTLLNSSSDYALIFEDDAIVHSNYFEMIHAELSAFEKLIQNPVNTKSILSFYTENAIGVVPLFSRTRFLRLKGFPSGAVAYAISRDASVELLKANMNLDFVADWPRVKNLKFYLTRRKWVNHPETRSESLMHDRIIWRDPRQKFFVDTVRIFSLYSYFKNRNFFIDFRQYLSLMIFPMVQWQVGRLIGKRSKVWGSGVKLRIGLFH